MNAAIRSVVRCGVNKGWMTYGVRNGYQGLIDGLIEPMGTREVGGILQRGGTMLGSARCEDFKTFEGRERAISALTKKAWMLWWSLAVMVHKLAVMNSRRWDFR